MGSEVAPVSDVPSARGKVFDAVVYLPRCLFVCCCLFVFFTARVRPKAPFTASDSRALIVVPQDDGDVEDDMTIREVRRSGFLPDSLPSKLHSTLH